MSQLMGHAVTSPAPVSTCLSEHTFSSAEVGISAGAARVGMAVEVG